MKEFLLMNWFDDYGEDMKDNSKVSGFISGVLGLKVVGEIQKDLIFHTDQTRLRRGIFPFFCLSIFNSDSTEREDSAFVLLVYSVWNGGLLKGCRILDP